MKKSFIAILFIFITARVFALPNLLSKEQYEVSAIKNLEVDLSSDDLIIKETSETSSIDVEIYCNFKKFAPEVSVSDSTLYIESTPRTITFFPEKTGFSCTVVIYIPQGKVFEEIDLETTSGDIEIETQISGKSKIEIMASSGDISSKSGLFADEINLSASSGDIDLFNIDADDFKVQTSSGDITIKKFTGGTGSIRTTSGDIKAEDYATEYAQFRSSSGEITVKKLDCDYFDSESSSGDVCLELKNAPIASSSIETSSGTVELYLPMRGKFSLDVSSNSGTFRDKFNNNRMAPRDNYHQDYNGGGSIITIRSSSGDITLDY